MLVHLSPARAKPPSNFSYAAALDSLWGQMAYNSSREEKIRHCMALYLLQRSLLEGCSSHGIVLPIKPLQHDMPQLCSIALNRHRLDAGWMRPLPGLEAEAGTLMSRGASVRASAPMSPLQSRSLCRGVQ